MPTDAKRALKIDPLRAWTSQLRDGVVRADGDDASIADRQRLQRPELRVDAHNLAGMEDVGRCGLGR